MNGMELLGNAAARKRNETDDTRALRRSVKLVRNVESSRQVVERGCPQNLAKLYEKKFRIPFIIIIAIFVFWKGKKAKLSDQVGEL